MSEHLKTGVAYGALVPSKADLETIVYGLAEKLKSDRKLAEEFRKHPRHILGALGLFEDIQSELLRETTSERDCSFTCLITCWFTGHALGRVLIDLEARPEVP